MSHLNNRVHLYGRQLRIIKSKHQNVQMPKDGQEAAKLTQGLLHKIIKIPRMKGSNQFLNFSLSMIESLR